MSEEKVKYEVSDKFANIHRLFNVFDQIEEMNKLSEEELYLLLTYCVDTHDENNETVCRNLEPFIPILDKIETLQDDLDDEEKKLNIDPILITLGEKTGNKYIDTDIIVDKNGNELPDVLSFDEVRELRIEKTLDTK